MDIKYGEPEHPYDVIQHLWSPVDVTVQENFRIGTRTKAVTEGFELSAKFKIIVYLSVKNDMISTVHGLHGLVACR